MGEKKRDSSKTSKQTYENALKCSLCARSFRYDRDLHHHTFSHTKEKPFKCNHCDFTTAYKEHLGIHVTKKHKDKSIWEKRLKYKFKLYSFKKHLKSTWDYHMTTWQRIRERGISLANLVSATTWPRVTAHCGNITVRYAQRWTPISLRSGGMFVPWKIQEGFEVPHDDAQQWNVLPLFWDKL